MRVTHEVAVPSPQLFTVQDVMTREVISVRADVGVDSAAEMMLDRGISGAPVINEEGVLVGMISKTDLVREAAEENAHEEDDDAFLPAGTRELRFRTVSEVMSPGAMTVASEAPLTHAAMLMARSNVHRLPVVGKDGRLVGLVSSLDIVRWVAEMS